MTEYAREVIDRQPEPPRRVPIGSILWHSYRSHGGIAMIGVALVLGLPMTFVTLLLVVGPAWQRVPLAAFFGLLTASFASIPAIGALRIRRALRRGVTVPGEVVSVRWTAPELRPPTIDAAEHGMASGRRRVYHPAQTFEEPFESDARWASRLEPGSPIRLLADPVQPKVLVDLGPESLE